jgi:hypothetical protein
MNCVFKHASVQMYNPPVVPTTRSAVAKSNVEYVSIYISMYMNMTYNY